MDLAQRPDVQQVLQFLPGGGQDIRLLADNVRHAADSNCLVIGNDAILHAADIHLACGGVLPALLWLRQVADGRWWWYMNSEDDGENNEVEEGAEPEPVPIQMPVPLQGQGQGQGQEHIVEMDIDA